MDHIALFYWVQYGSSGMALDAYKAKRYGEVSGRQ
jgi:hypothetical protein